MAASKIHLLLQIPDPHPNDEGSTVRVALRDTTEADALHPTVAEATGVVGPDGEEAEVSIEVPDKPLDPRHRYSVWAHVDHVGQGELRTGDLVTTQNVPVGPGDVDSSPVDVPLTRI